MLNSPLSLLNLNGKPLRDTLKTCLICAGPGGASAIAVARAPSQSNEVLTTPCPT